MPCANCDVNSLEKGLSGIQISNCFICDKQRKTKQGSHKGHPEFKVEKDHRTWGANATSFCSSFLKFQLIA